MAIYFDPMATLTALDSFVADTQGYVQGTVLDDPAVRFQLESGQIAASVTQPVWGGLPITLTVPASPELGSAITLSTAYANIDGWSVFNQAHNMVLTPGNNVPQAVAGMTANLFRIGTLARIVVKCDPTLINTLAGGAANQQVSWDFTNNQLIAFSTTALPVVVEAVSTTSKTVTYNSGTGALTWSNSGSVAVIRI